MSQRFSTTRVYAAFTALLLICAVVPLSGCNDSEAKSAGSAKAGYLSADLRADIEKLKAEVAKEPTNKENVAWRNKVLWKWINAWAVSGRYVPVNASLIATVNVMMPQGMSMTGMQSHAMLDQYVREFTLVEKEPGVLGSAEITTKGPFIIDSYATVEQVYTAGSRGIRTGGGVLLAFQWSSDQGSFQAFDPKAPNYVSAKSSNSNVTLKPVKTPYGGMHGGFYGIADLVFFQVEGADLKEGDTITITYGDTSQGSPGLRMQTHSNDSVSYPLYVDIAGQARPELMGGREFLSVPLKSVVLLGDKVAGVHGFAPSIVKTGEPFELSVRAEDRYSNKATGDIPAFELLVNGQVFKTTAAGTDAITLLKDVRFDKPGAYHVAIRSEDGKITGKANPILVEDNPQTRIYWGETHGHSGMSEGQGSSEGYWRFARDEARLDYATHSEHDIWLDDAEWEKMRRDVQAFYEEGKFIPFLGYEWTALRQWGGHHNVLFRTPEGHARVPMQDASKLSALYQGLRAANNVNDVLIIPHAHEPGDWRRNDPDMEKVTEIMSEHGTFEWFGQKYLASGAEVGFVSGSDNHMGHPGYSSPRDFGGLQQRGGLGAVLASEKTGNAIFNALRARSTYADTSSRIVLLTKVNDTMMGGRAKFSPTRKIEGRVVGSDQIQAVTIMRNGEKLWSKDYAVADQGPSTRYLVEFETSSVPLFGQFGQPRGWRLWVGDMNVTGARVVNATLVGFDNPRRGYVRINKSNPSAVEFETQTRGSRSGVLLELADVTGALAVTINLKAAKEEGYSPSPDSPTKAGETPAATLKLAASAMKGGVAATTLPSSGFYKDDIRLRRMKSEVPKEVTFSYTDTDRLVPGDYYYVRVDQVDGHRAWSSPVWVGGYPPL